MSNSIGKIFRLTTFGESHGAAIGGIIDGCPAGLELDMEFIQSELDRRKPGQSKITTQRKESDEVQFLSGVFEGKTTGTPIGFMIPNSDQRSKDYSALKNVYRPSHADYTYEKKYGTRDYRGGGRSSARETACRVVAGAIAKLILKQSGIEVQAYVKSIGSISLSEDMAVSQIASAEESIVRCPDEGVAAQMIAEIERVGKEGDSLGGVVHAVISGVPAGLGEPVFDKFNAALGHAVLGINAVKGFEIGKGFEAARMQGSAHNDSFESAGDHIKTTTNNSGGIQGGITNGMEIRFNTAFKPVATIRKNQETVTKEGEKTSLSAEGRHDPCVVPRAVPIVEAMAALVTLDMLLLQRTTKL